MMVRIKTNLKKLYSSLPVFGPLPFSVKKEFREVYSRIYFCKSHKYGKIPRTMMFIPTLLLWYVKAVVMIVREVKIHSPRVRRIHHTGYLKQITGICHLAFIKNAPPDLYYYLRLWENKIRIGENYLVDEHFVPVLSYLIHGKNWEVLTDKLRFREHFKPVIPELIEIIGEFRNGEMILTNGKGNIPETDMFVKPLDGHGGIGCQRIHYLQNGRYLFGSNGIQVDKANLIILLKHNSKDCTTILQPFIQNHPKLTRLSNGNLATCRINTYNAPDKEVGYLFAIFMMPVEDSVTSNTNGIHSLVDLKTGILVPARNMKDPFNPIETHPQGGGKINGTMLPFWEQSLELCKKAHHVLPELPIIAWDVAFTPDGPVLVEGNLIWPVGFWTIQHLNEQECVRFVKIIEGYLKETRTTCSA